MTCDEIIQIMNKAKELGIKSFTNGALTFSFEGSVKDAPAPVPDMKVEELIKPIQEEMTSEEILYYATPYYEELQAKKADHAKKLAEEGLKTP